MRMLLIVAVIILGLILLGWIAFDKDDDSASLELNTDKLQQDTSEAVRKTGEWIEDSGRKLEQSAETR